jgi:hypothetical protein
MLQQIADWIVEIIHTVWNWATGEINSLINLPWDILPVWKWYLAVLGAIVVAGLLLWAIYLMFEAFQSLFMALGQLLYRLFYALPQLLAAGVVAYGVLFVIRSF